ncbi:hypothetical protein [Amycolatopsis speibonae]|uniref:MFS transporter n=1 Tax=Amycolatopsis speibonae TaxID=1450224 RepID=A0ABV7P456_9PSEU
MTGATRTGVFAVLRSTPAPVRYLLGGVLVNQLGAFVQTFLILYLTFRGTSVGFAGICLAAYSVGAIFGAMLGGELTHRFGGRATMVLATGEVICGHTVNTPEVAEDGHLRLREVWERYGPHAATGVSYLDEVS